MLTTGSDTGASFTGGSGNDTFNADLSTTGTNTLNVLDRLDGGVGTDTLNVVLASDVTPASLANIESIVATGSGGAARNLSLANAASVTDVTVTGSTAGSVVTVSNIAAGANLNVSAQAVHAVFEYASTTGTQSVNLGVSGVTGGAEITIAGVETVTTTATGSASTYDLKTAAASTLNFAGSANQTVTIDATVLGVSKFDASAATGNVTLTTIDQTSLASTTDVTVLGGAGNDSLTLVESNDLTVNGGAGNDTITMAAIDASDTVDGGEGTDTLVTVNAQANVLDAVATTKITNVEALTITDALDGTVDLTKIASGMNTVSLSLATASGVIMTGGDGITGPAGSLTVNVGGSGAGNTTTMTGALTVTDTGTATTDSVTINNTAVNSTTDLNVNIFSGQNITSTGYENVTVGVGSKAYTSARTTIGTLTITPDAVSANVSLTLTGSNDVAITSVATTSTGLLTIDGSGVSADADSSWITISGTTSGTGGTQSITGSAGNDSITVGNFAATIVGGAGNDTLAGGTAADNIQGGDGADTITGGGGNDVISGGAGNDSITVSGTSVNVDAGAGDDTVNVDATLSSGDTIVGGEGTDTLAIDAAATAESSQGVSGFEILRFDSTGLNQDMVQFTQNSTFTRLDYNINAGSNAVTNAGAAITEIRVLNGTTLAQFDRLLDNASNALTVGALTDAATTITTLTVNDEETLTIDDGAIDSTHALTITTLNADDLVTLNVTGGADVTITNAIAGANDTLTTVNASANTGTVSISAASSTVAMTMTGSATAASTLTGGSGADAITGGSAADSLTGGANNDTIDGGAGADSLLGGTGADSITGGEGADSITGGAGNDTIVLTETTAAADRVVLEATAAGNGVDSIIGFTAGTGGDVLVIDAFLNATAMNAVLTANPGAGVNVENDVNLLVDIVDGQDITTAAGLTTALAAGGEYANINMAINSSAVFVTAASSSATTQNVFYATSDAAGAITVTLVGTISGVDIDNFVAANFNI